MISLICSIAAAIFYIAASGFILTQLKHKRPLASPWLQAFAACAISFHAAGLYQIIIPGNGFNLTLLAVSSLMFLAVNSIVLFSSLQKPMHNLYLFLFPLSAIAVLLSLIAPEPHELLHLPQGTLIHVILSIAAYSVLFIATLQALLLAYQNWHLRHRHPGGLVRLLPPLQLMEALLF